MKTYTISGMSCAACAARIEKAVRTVGGVDSCSVSLLTNSMSVSGTADEQEIIHAVEKAGYGAESSEPADKKEKARPDTDALRNKDTPVLLKRLVSSALFLAALMYCTMGQMMLGLPLPAFFSGNMLATGMLQMILAALILLINNAFFSNGIKNLLRASPNMDSLVALGSGISFIYSTAVLFAMTDAALRNDAATLSDGMNNLYFEGSAMIVTLITFGKLLESISKGKTTSALKALLNLAPKKAVLIRDGKEVSVDIEELRAGDVFAVRPGEAIPADGIILDGKTAVNESALTGESIPADKEPGSTVSAATLNVSGYITCRALKVGTDTTLSHIIQIMKDAAATKAPIAKAADRVSGIFVPVILLIAAFTFTIWTLMDAGIAYSLSRAISVLVVSCPCALGLATPVAIMVGSGVGARNGILFKTSAALENAGRTKVAILDKTGTLTKGQPEITDIVPADGISQDELIAAAVSLEAKSEHPLAKAITAKAAELHIPAEDISDFRIASGSGLRGTVLKQNADGTQTAEERIGGSMSYIEEFASINKNLKMQAETARESGKTPLFFARTKGGKTEILGFAAAADALKEDSPEAVRQLKEMGIETVMLTGDAEKTARAIAAQAGIERVIAGVLPDGKEQAVREIKQSVRNKKHTVTMVGDGINDAPALARADTGIALGAGTDIAIDAAEVVLMRNSLLDVCTAIKLSRATLKNIHENLFWAFFYNILLIPVAAGAYHTLLGIDMNPMLAAAAMSISSVCVVTNALRLNLIKLKKKQKKEQPRMNETTEKTLHVEGMMCAHCEAHVKEALEKIDGVSEATADHTKNSVTVTLSKEVPEDALKKAVTDAGYTYKG